LITSDNQFPPFGNPLEHAASAQAPQPSAPDQALAPVNQAPIRELTQKAAKSGKQGCFVWNHLR
jgi:hypothetical protein